MDRRNFLALSAAASAAFALPASAGQTLDYTPGLVDAQLAAGKTVMLDFAASWCSTCAAQERVIGALKSENAAYEANIVFIRVDWDAFRRAEITLRLAIPRRSTLVVLKGDAELGRIVAGTGRAQIKQLMDSALSAATA
ncbi:MAG: thioredoxin 1 [Sulfitobacter sp.]|jgi:thioredoxin 1